MKRKARKNIARARNRQSGLKKGISVGPRAGDSRRFMPIVPDLKVTIIGGVPSSRANFADVIEAAAKLLGFADVQRTQTLARPLFHPHPENSEELVLVRRHAKAGR